MKTDGSLPIPEKAPVRLTADLSFHLLNAVKAADRLAQTERPHPYRADAERAAEIIRRLRRKVREWSGELENH
jgi:hypothetical protein